jgi:hypothetical protein
MAQWLCNLLPSKYYIEIFDDYIINHLIIPCVDDK